MERSPMRMRLSLSAAYDDVQDIDKLRRKNDRRLRGRFQAIFNKYDHDFTELTDEIDLECGQVVVDRGHLTRMRSEFDVSGHAVTNEDAYLRDQSRLSNVSGDDELSSPLRPAAAHPADLPSRTNDNYDVLEEQDQQEEPSNTTANLTRQVASSTFTQATLFDPTNPISIEALGKNIALQLAKLIPTVPRTRPSPHFEAQHPQLSLESRKRSPSERNIERQRRRHSLKATSWESPSLPRRRGRPRLSTSLWAEDVSSPSTQSPPKPLGRPPGLHKSSHNPSSPFVSVETISTPYIHKLPNRRGRPPKSRVSSHGVQAASVWVGPASTSPPPSSRKCHDRPSRTHVLSHDANVISSEMGQLDVPGPQTKNNDVATEEIVKCRGKGYKQDEDERLILLRQQGVAWKDMKSKLPGRSFHSIYSRWNNFLRFRVPSAEIGAAEQTTVWSPRASLETDCPPKVPNQAVSDTHQMVAHAATMSPRSARPSGVSEEERMEAQQTHIRSPTASPGSEHFRSVTHETNLDTQQTVVRSAIASSELEYHPSAADQANSKLERTLSRPLTEILKPERERPQSRKRGPKPIQWSHEELELLVTLKDQQLLEWSTIAARLPGKGKESTIRNVYYSLPKVGKDRAPLSSNVPFRTGVSLRGMNYGGRLFNGGRLSLPNPISHTTWEKRQDTDNEDLRSNFRSTVSATHSQKESPRRTRLVRAAPRRYVQDFVFNNVEEEALAVEEYDKQTRKRDRPDSAEEPAILADKMAEHIKKRKRGRPRKQFSDNVMANTRETVNVGSQEITASSVGNIAEIETMAGSPAVERSQDELYTKNAAASTSDAELSSSAKAPVTSLVATDNLHAQDLPVESYSREEGLWLGCSVDQDLSGLSLEKSNAEKIHCPKSLEASQASLTPTKGTSGERIGTSEDSGLRVRKPAKFANAIMISSAQTPGASHDNIPSAKRSAKQTSNETAGSAKRGETGGYFGLNVIKPAIFANARMTPSPKTLGASQESIPTTTRTSKQKSAGKPVMAKQDESIEDLGSDDDLTFAETSLLVKAA